MQGLRPLHLLRDLEHRDKDLRAAMEQMVLHPSPHVVAAVARALLAGTREPLWQQLLVVWAV